MKPVGSVAERCFDVHDAQAVEGEQLRPLGEVGAEQPLAGMQEGRSEQVEIAERPVPGVRRSGPFLGLCVERVPVETLGEQFVPRLRDTGRRAHQVDLFDLVVARLPGTALAQCRDDRAHHARADIVTYSGGVGAERRFGIGVGPRRGRRVGRLEA